MRARGQRGAIRGVEVRWSRRAPRSFDWTFARAGGKHRERSKVDDEAFGALTGNAELRAVSPKRPFDSETLFLRAQHTGRVAMSDTNVSEDGRARATLWGPCDGTDPGSLIEPRAFVQPVESVLVVIDLGSQDATHADIELDARGQRLALSPAGVAGAALGGPGRIVRTLSVDRLDPGNHEVRFLVSSGGESFAAIPMTLRVVDVLKTSLKISRRTVGKGAARARVTAMVALDGGLARETVTWSFDLAASIRGGNVRLSVTTVAFQCNVVFAEPLIGALPGVFFDLPAGAVPPVLATPTGGKRGRPWKRRLLGFLHWVTAIAGASLGALSVQAVKAIVAALLQLLGPEIGVPGTLGLYTPKVEVFVTWLMGAVGREAGRDLNLAIERKLREDENGAPGEGEAAPATPPETCNEGSTRDTPGPRLKRRRPDARSSVRGPGGVRYCASYVEEEFIVWVREVCRGGRWVFSQATEQIVSTATRRKCFVTEAEREAFVTSLQ